MKYVFGASGAVETELAFGTLHISSNEEIGFRPFQLLVSSIVGCSGGLLKTILEKKKIQYDSIEMDVKVERNPEEANKITKIALHFIVYGENLKEETLQKSLNLAMKNCSMAQSVKGAIEIVETIEKREKTV